MNATDIRKELHEYIDIADENRLKAIHEILREAEKKVTWQAH